MTTSQYVRQRRGTAVVIGGSIAGCTAAGALTEHYERVVVLDRDELPNGPIDRQGASHAYQFHALLSGGRKAMDALLPGVTERAVNTGVPQHDPGMTRYCSKFGFFRLVETDEMVLLASRLHLEWILRSKAQHITGVTIRSRTRVTGLRARDGVVTGVEMINESTGQAETLAADLVVDASGRGSDTPDWLATLGYPRPDETTVNARWSYVTTYVRPGPRWTPDYQVLYVTPTLAGDGPAATRGAGMWAQENGLW